MSEEKECLGRLFKQIHFAFEMNGARLMKAVDVTPAQMDVMLLLYAKEREGSEVTQKDIETVLRLSNPTVTGLLNRMEEKGLVHCEISGKGKSYTPAVEQEQAEISETRSFLKRVYRGSVGLMISAMAQRQELSGDEIAELRAILDQAEKGGPQ